LAVNKSGQVPQEKNDKPIVRPHRPKSMEQAQRDRKKKKKSRLLTEKKIINRRGQKKNLKIVVILVCWQKGWLSLTLVLRPTRSCRGGKGQDLVGMLQKLKKKEIG